jgi:hypothetical protein
MRFLLAVLVACSSPSSTDTVEPPRVASGSAEPQPTSPRVQLPAMATWERLTDKFLALRVHGDDRSCAVSRDGRVACWGALGGRDASRIETGVPHLLKGVTGVVDVVSLPDAVCVLRADGSGGCVPTRDNVAPAPFSAVEIAGRQHELCLRTRDGRVGCYATDYKGPPELVFAKGITGATSLTCMADGCCATTATTTLCTTDGDAKPLDGAPAGATRIAYAGDGGCALVDKGARCWGTAAALSRASASDVGFFHDGVCVLDGTQLHCEGRAIDNVVRARHDCAVHPDGSVSCLGSNWHGELGDGHPAFVTTPQRVPDLEDVVDLRVGHSEVCAVRRDRSLECWGWVPRKQLGKIPGGAVLGGGWLPCWIAAGKLHCHDAPDRPITSWGLLKVVPLGLAAAPAVWALDGETLCVAAAGKLRCRARLFKPLDDDDAWVDVATGNVAELDDFDNGLAVRFTDGRVGYLELGDVELSEAKLTLLDIRDATKLASGNFEICVQQRSGDVTCWTTDKHSVPAIVPGFAGATAIAAHTYHRCAIVRGEVTCSGRNDHGQLGRGSVHAVHDDQPPQAVKLPAEPLAIGVAEDSTCALVKTGHVWCWGSDQDGVLGRGRLRARATLGKVVGLGP